jgi:hypothetical protein
MDQMIGNLFVKGHSQQEQLIDIGKLQNIVGVYFYLYSTNTEIEVQ